MPCEEHPAWVVVTLLLDGVCLLWLLTTVEELLLLPEVLGCWL